MNNERLAGGLLCSEVLALLSDYVDGELDAQTESAINAHLAACDNCLRFGGSFQKMMEGVSHPAEALPEEVSKRLSERLVQALPKI